MGWRISRFLKKPLLFLSVNAKKQLTGPVEVQLMPTSKCDLNCLPCFRMKYTPDMDPKLLAGLFQSLDRLGVERLVLSGKRNPLLYSHINELLDLGKSHRLQVGVILNNLSFTRKNLELLSRFDFFYVSVLACTRHSFTLVHPNTPFLRYRESISLLRKFGKKIHRLNVTLFEQNYRDIVPFLELGEALSLPVYFNIAVTAHKPEIEVRDKQDLLRLWSLARRFASLHKIATNLGGLGKVSGRIPPCYLGYWQTSVSSTGRVFFCCRNGISLGNIKSTSLERIWYSKAYERLRNVRYHGARCNKECLFRHINLQLARFDILRGQD